MMKREDLFELMGSLDPSLIEEAISYEREDINTKEARSWKKYGITAVSACLILVMGLPFFHHTPLPEIQTAPVHPDMQLISGVESAGSSEELSQLVGFQVPSIPELPFEIHEIVYSSYWNKMAQITCSDSERTAVLRMTPGTEDCSGDYTQYAVQKKLEIQDLSISLKGQEEDAFHLAVWSDGEYSYSIKMDQGISAEQWEEIILSFPNV